MDAIGTDNALVMRLFLMHLFQIFVIDILLGIMDAIAHILSCFLDHRPSEGRKAEAGPGLHCAHQAVGFGKARKNGNLAQRQGRVGDVVDHHLAPCFRFDLPITGSFGFQAAPQRLTADGEFLGKIFHRRQWRHAIEIGAQRRFEQAAPGPMEVIALFRIETIIGEFCQILDVANDPPIQMAARED